MAHRIAWIELRIGVLSTVAVLVGAFLILAFGRVGRLHGPTFRLFVTTDAARGVLRGTEVWLDGQKVGLVRDVAFRSPMTASRDRLVLGLDILNDARSRIRLDTRVQIRSGSSIIGDQVVYMNSGTVRRREVQGGDTIRAGGQTDLEGLSSDAAIATRQFPAIIQNVKVLAAQLQTAQGTLGALGVNPEAEAMVRIRQKSDRLMRRLSDTTGIFGLAGFGGAELRIRAARASAELDSIRVLVTSNRHSLGRFQKDTTLVREMDRIQGELQELERRAASPGGTLGRFRADSAITRGIQRDLAALDSLFADMKKHPLRYIPF